MHLHLGHLSFLLQRTLNDNSLMIESNIFSKYENKYLNGDNIFLLRMIDRKININPAIRKICKGAGKNTNAPKAKKKLEKSKVVSSRPIVFNEFCVAHKALLCKNG